MHELTQYYLEKKAAPGLLQRLRKGWNRRNQVRSGEAANNMLAAMRRRDQPGGYYDKMLAKNKSSASANRDMQNYNQLRGMNRFAKKPTSPLWGDY